MYASATMWNLISTIDVNGQQIDVVIETVLCFRDLRKKFEVFGWEKFLPSS
jgi:transketolase